MVMYGRFCFPLHSRLRCASRLARPRYRGPDRRGQGTRADRRNRFFRCHANRIGPGGRPECARPCRFSSCGSSIAHHVERRFRALPRLAGLADCEPAGFRRGGWTGRRPAGRDSDRLRAGFCQPESLSGVCLPFRLVRRFGTSVCDGRHNCQMGPVRGSDGCGRSRVDGDRRRVGPDHAFSARRTRDEHRNGLDDTGGVFALILIMAGAKDRNCFHPLLNACLCDVSLSLNR
ncbi:hypothetical protein EV665_12398 [Shinella granuli]|uniref:Uncharacterized protein n=1 Tax=Shinella granuli TaxID=323621 RepID=A0A4R2CDT8_SHIGR|nr:hypothetical protein EV665_12398 [Shinella granuli]